MSPNKLKSQRQKRKERREKGLCQDCYEPAEEGKTRCKKHLELNVVYVLKSKRKRVSEGRCWGCGRERDDGMWSKNKWECLHCQEKAYIRRDINGRKS